MNTEFTVEQIRAFVARGYNSVAARMTKSLLQHYDALASNPKEPEAVHGNEAEKGVCKCERPHLYQDTGFNWRCSLCGNPF